MRLSLRRATGRAGGRPAPAVLPPEERALTRAFGRHLGLSLNPDRARAWVAAGWRAADAETIAAMSAAAVAAGSSHGRRYRAEPAGLTKRLGEVVVAWHIHCRLSRPEVLGWLAVLAAAPSDADARALEDLVEGSRSFRQQAGPARGTAEITRWRALPVELGPLAWAAGLSAEEAARDPDPAELRLLAGLRGFRVADVPDTGRPAGGHWRR